VKRSTTGSTAPPTIKCHAESEAAERQGMHGCHLAELFISTHVSVTTASRQSDVTLKHGYAAVSAAISDSTTFCSGAEGVMYTMQEA
jgi:hypothetical protein